MFGRPRNRFNLPESIRDPVNEDMLNQLAQKKLLFVITDVSQPHQPIVFASETFLAFTGYSQAEVLNRPLLKTHGGQMVTVQWILVVKSVLLVPSVLGGPLSVINSLPNGNRFQFV